MLVTQGSPVTKCTKLRVLSQLDTTHETSASHPWLRTKGYARRASGIYRVSNSESTACQPGLFGTSPIRLRSAFQHQRTAKIGRTWHPQDSRRVRYPMLKANSGKNLRPSILQRLQPSHCCKHWHNFIQVTWFLRSLPTCRPNKSYLICFQVIDRFLNRRFDIENKICFV